MMPDDPVIFVDSAEWRDAAGIERIEEELREAGFEQTREIALVPALGLLGQGWQHQALPFNAVVYESAEHGCWCELHAHNRKSDHYIATSAPVELEWPAGNKTIETMTDASVPLLFESLSSMTHGFPLERSDSVMFSLHLHGRLEQHWSYVHSPSPAEARRRAEDQREQLKIWLDGFVGCFRPLGFLSAATGLADEELVRLLLDYSDPLFERFPGVADVCDDFDELSDFFSMDELAKMPAGNQLMDVKLLAVLDPERVRWARAIETYAREWDEEQVARRCATEGLSPIEYSAPVTDDENDLFACEYIILLPSRCLAALTRDRGWAL